MMRLGHSTSCRTAAARSRRSSGGLELTDGPSSDAWAPVMATADLAAFGAEHPSGGAADAAVAPVTTQARIAEPRSTG